MKHNDWIGESFSTEIPSHIHRTECLESGCLQVIFLQLPVLGHRQFVCVWLSWCFRERTVVFLHNHLGVTGWTVRWSICHHEGMSHWLTVKQSLTFSPQVGGMNRCRGLCICIRCVCVCLRTPVLACSKQFSTCLKHLSVFQLAFLSAVKSGGLWT